MSYYSDDEVDSAIETWERDPSGELPIPDELIDRLSEDQADRYHAALRRVEHRLSVRAHQDWWSDPPGTPVPESGIWWWPGAPDDEMDNLLADPKANPPNPGV